MKVCLICGEIGPDCSHQRGWELSDDPWQASLQQGLYRADGDIPLDLRLTPFLRLHFGNKKESVHHDIICNGYLTKNQIIQLLRHLADDLEA